MILAKFHTINVTSITHKITQRLDKLTHCTVKIPSHKFDALTHKSRQRTLIGGPILIITAIAALLGISIVSILFQQELSATFLFLFTSMPRFDVLGTDSTSALYSMYDNFRTISFFVMSVAIVMAGLSFGLESVNLVPPKLGAKILGNGILYLILIMIFPYFWDMIVDVVEWTSLWILSPTDPSMAHHTVATLLSYMSPGVYPNVDYVGLFGDAGLTIASVAFTSLVDTIIGNESNILEAVGESYQRKITIFLTEVFLYVFKAIALFTMSLTAFLLGTVRYVLTGLLAVAVPLILALSLIPQFNRITGLMRDTLVALMIVPIFSALAISAGVAVLIDLDSGEFGTFNVISDESNNDLHPPPPVLQELTYGVRKFFMALAVLALAIYFPAMLAPMLTSVMSSIQQHISTAGLAGGIIASGTQAAIAQSAPALRWGAQKAFRSGTALSDLVKYGRGAPKFSKRHTDTPSPAQTSFKRIDKPSRLQPFKRVSLSKLELAYKQKQEQRKSGQLKLWSQINIINKGNPKIPKTRSSRSS